MKRTRSVLCGIIMAGCILLSGNVLTNPVYADTGVYGVVEPDSDGKNSGGSVKTVLSQETSDVRVWLKSLGNPESLMLTVSGSYSAGANDEYSFSDQTSFTIAAHGKDLFMRVEGLTVNMGPEVTLVRQGISETEECGLVISETGRENLYCGDLRIRNENGCIQAVANMDMDEYLYGVVPYEMSDSFPMEALKAQAVAARTYAMSRKCAKHDYDVVDTAGDQVFRGLNPKNTNAIAAVDETRGMVLRYKGKYACCYFTASNGGQTELPQHIWGNDGDYGYLEVTDDPYDLENPDSPVKSLVLSASGEDINSRLSETLRASLAEQMLPMGYSDEMEDIRIDRIETMECVHPKYGGKSRMYQNLRMGLRVEGKKIDTDFAAPDPVNKMEMIPQILYVDVDFYNDLKQNYDLGVSAIDCEVLSVVPMKDGLPAPKGQTPDSFRIESRRFGHGVGMSQRGAQQMARAYHMGYLEILRFYYPGAEPVCVDYERKTLQKEKKRPETVEAQTSAPLPALREGERYAVVKLESMNSVLNVREKPDIQARIQGTLCQNQKVIIRKSDNDQWVKVKTAELEGYCFAEYVKRS